MCNGIQIIADLTAGLARYLNAHGFACVADIIGKALPSLCVWTDLDLGWRRVAAVDEELCNGCGLCINACDSGGFQAIRIQAEKAYVDSSRCDGCGLCPGICPQEAILLLPGNERKV
jgi:dihydropyrimidine dehydrogenase (NAD+) subunit PreA